MNTVILYYSETKKTEVVAKTLANELNADSVLIKDLKERKGFFNRFNSSVDAFREKKTEIYPDKIDLTNYSLIYIGTPTWANNPTPALITLIDKLDLKGKDVVLFTTLSNAGGENTLKRMQEKVKLRGGRVIESFEVATKDKSLIQLERDSIRIARALDLNIYS